MTPLLEVSGLSVNYGGIEAVRDVSFAVHESEVVVLLGSNGAGKSSTLRAILGLVPKASGDVHLFGTPVTNRPPHRIARMGLRLVPEGRRIIAPLTVEENLLLGGHHIRDSSVIRDSLELVYGLFPVLEQRQKTAAGLMSGGEQQMLALGRVLMGKPEIVMMDEPSMGLAPSVVETVMEKVAEISALGVSILMVEQNAAAALEVASRGLVLEQGRIVLAGSSAELRSNDLVLEAFLGTSKGGAKRR